MADNITVKDAAATNRILATSEDGGTLVHTPKHEVTVSALPAGAATQTTLAALNTKVTACNTGAVVVSSSVLATDAATQTTLAALNTKVTACNTGSVTVAGSALPTGAATQTTLAALNTKVTACNTGAVVLAGGSANIGDVDVLSVAIPSAIYHGKKVVTAGTDETIGSSQAITSGVTVKALAGNAGLVYVGKLNVSSSDGFELSAKESVFIECDNITTVFIDAATGSADGITYIAT